MDNLQVSAAFSHHHKSFFLLQKETMTESYSWSTHREDLALGYLPPTLASTIQLMHLRLREHQEAGVGQKDSKSQGTRTSGKLCLLVVTGKSEQHDWVSKTRTIPTTVGVLSAMGNISWSPTLGEELPLLATSERRRISLPPEPGPDWLPSTKQPALKTYMLVTLNRLHLFLRIHGTTMI